MGARILVAEDDITTRTMVRGLLEGDGHIVLLSPDGQHAWETLQTDERIELVVTDMQMPRADGRELIRLMRGTERLRRLPVIIMSAVVGVKEISDLLKLGASRFQPKPLVSEAFISGVNACLAVAATGDRGAADRY